VSKLISKGIVKAGGYINMDNRINYFKLAPKAMENIMEMEKYVRNSTIDKRLSELVKLRVSQINGCSYCINMHTKKAKKLKVSQEQLEQLTEWQNTELFNTEEKTALELAEKMTLISENGVSDELYERVRSYYDEKEYTDLVMIINQINLWNRLSIAMGNHA